MRLFIGVLLVALLWNGMSMDVHATTPSGVRSLAGVTALRVAVEDLNSATRKIGLHKEQIQAVAEAYLKEHGVKLVGAGSGTPMLYIRMSSVVGGEQPQAPISFYLTVQVKQFVYPAQFQKMAAAQDVEGSLPLLVTTWEDGTMAMTGRTELGFYVRQVLLILLGEFLQDYQDAKK
jgi:hypothetical protein